MMKRAYNFNAGPAALPEAVLKKAHATWFDYNGTGMSVMEMSHRSKEFSDINDGAQAALRRLMNIPDDYEVLFLQGGASLQFSMIPMNLLADNQTAHYILTGSWSEKALAEAKKHGRTNVVASTKEEQYRSIPALDNVDLGENAAYLHITSNNTIYGTQWNEFPKVDGVPLIADMSSDILSKQVNVSDFGMIYAGAQKNLGPSGVTVVIIRKDLLERGNDDLPTMLNYRTHAKSKSLYNTPPTLAIYLLKLVLEWLESVGGVAEIEKRNKEKATLLYETIANSNGFYKAHADKNSQSQMNVTFTLKDDETTKAFLTAASEAGFVGLNGHRSIGGCRASIYNAVPLEHVEKLATFMNQFRENFEK